MPVVVNADDLGMSPPVNAGVLQAFERGWISSATLMANMPAFAEAVELVRKHALAGKVGVHLNLTEGPPLTSAIRRSPRLCSREGELHAKGRDLFRVSGDERRAIHGELRAQVAACRAAGIEPTHLDSHHHVHTSWAVGGIVIAVAREFRIPFIRVAHNAGPLISRKHRLYSVFFNGRLALRSLVGVRYFCSLQSATTHLIDRCRSIEVMAHPYLNADGRVTDFPGGDLLETRLQPLLRGRTIVSYGQLRVVGQTLASG